MAAISRRDIAYRELESLWSQDALRLFGQVFESELGLPLADRITQEVEAAKAGYVPSRDLLATAELDGRLVGALLVTHEDFPPPPASRFSWFAVDPSARGHGVGRELLYRCIEACRKRRIPLLRARTFAASPTAVRLLWLHGFRVVQLASLAAGGRSRETLVFEKRLTPPPV